MSQNDASSISVVAFRAERYSQDGKSVLVSFRTKFSSAERKYLVPMECLRVGARLHVSPENRSEPSSEETPAETLGPSSPPTATEYADVSLQRPCQLVARNTSRSSASEMSALGQKQTFAVQTVMSALPPKADMCGATRDVRFVPKADIVPTRRLHRRGQAIWAALQYRATWQL